ncbi:hypothetical protein BDR06DRAFT_394375 [Suillus hirtellus]|nr:hypothetical protein BDR06DRAFT_394375 [Suillus hirtellus]
MCAQCRLLTQGYITNRLGVFSFTCNYRLETHSPSSPSPLINRFHFTQLMSPTNTIQLDASPPKKALRAASGAKHSGSGSQKRQDALGRMAQTSKKAIDRVLAAKSVSSSSSSFGKIPDGPMKSRKRNVAKKEMLLQMFPQRGCRGCAQEI